MGNNMILGSCLVLAANAVAAFSQLLLKIAAKKAYHTWWRSYLNILVLSAYAMFFGTTLLNAIAMRYISLSLTAALAASGQIWVPLVSYFFLKEKINKRMLAGMALIVLGIIIFSI